MRAISFIARAVFFLLPALWACGCDKPQAAGPAAPAYEEPVIPASQFDLSTPRAALRSFAKARFELRNLGAVKSMVVAEADPLALEQMKAEFAFCQVLRRRFGEEARNFPDSYLIPKDDYLRAARDGVEQVAGEAATIKHKDWKIPLRRRDSQWRLDFSPSADDLVDTQTRDILHSGWASIWQELSSEVAAGKYASLEEVHRACGQKMGRITQASFRR